MKGHLWSGVAVMLMALYGSSGAIADEHGESHHHGGDTTAVHASTQGAVVVRDVQVRDVQVRDVQVPRPRPSVSPRPEVPRPMLPDAISRPYQSPYPRPDDRVQQRHGRRSYYYFAPRVSIGYGLLVGYPVAYPYPYAYPFIYEPQASYPAYPSYPSSSSLAMAAPPRNTYSNIESVVAGAPSVGAINCTIDPGSPAPCGGVSFDVSPATAQVSVDGVYVGTVESFSPTRPPLALAPGLHYIEVRLPGFRTAAFEVTIGGGDVTPYQGALEPLRTQ